MCLFWAPFFPNSHLQIRKTTVFVVVQSSPAYTLYALSCELASINQSKPTPKCKFHHDSRGPFGAGTSSDKKKFSDAINMIGERKGIQVHRSHWVASDYIQGRSIKGGLNFVEMKTDQYVPLVAANTVKLDAHLNRYG